MVNKRKKKVENVNYTTTVHINLKSRIFFCRIPSTFPHCLCAVGAFLACAISRNESECSSNIFRNQMGMKSGLSFPLLFSLPSAQSAALFLHLKHPLRRRDFECNRTKCDATVRRDQMLSPSDTGFYD